MDLNADVEEGLTDDPLVSAPIHKSHNDVEVTLVTSTDTKVESTPVSSQELFGDEIELGKLPDINAKLSVITDNKAKIVDLKDVEATIIGQGGISQEDAKLVDQQFGPFFHTRLSVHEFTKTRTKANYDVTKRFIQNRISSEEHAISMELQAVFKEPLEELEVFEDHFKRVYRPQLDENIQTLRKTFDDVVSNVQFSKNTVLPINGEFINVLEVPLMSFDIAGKIEAFFKNNGQAQPQLQDTISAIKAILSNLSLVDFISKAINNDRFEMPVQSSLPTMMEKSSTLAINDIISFYKSETLIANLDSLIEHISNAGDFLRSKDVDLKTLTEDYTVIDFNVVNPFITANLEEIQHCSERAIYVHEVVGGLMRLNRCVVNLLHFLRYCL